MPIEYPRKRRRYIRRPPKPKHVNGDNPSPSTAGEAKILGTFIQANTKDAEKAARRAERAEEYYRRYRAKKELADAAKAEAKLARDNFRAIQAEAWAYEKNIRKEIIAHNRADKASRKLQSSSERYATDREAVDAHDRRHSNLELYIPEWSDVIRIGPNPKATKEEMREYYKAVAEGRPPNLDPDLIAAIENKRRKMLAMKNSEVPDAVNKLGRVLTVIDNINDAMITASYLARVGALVAPPFAPFLLGVSAGLLVGANILNLAMWLSPLALPQQLAKRQMSKMLRKFGVKGLLKGIGLPPQVAKFLPSFSEAIQIAQTAADFTGYGLSIGPIYGAVQEGLFRNVVNPVDRVLGSPVAGFSKWAAKGMDACAEMFGFGSLFSPMDHLYDLCCLWACLCYLSTPLTQTAMPYLIDRELDTLVTTEHDTDEGNRELLIQEGVNPDVEPYFLWPGAENVMLIDETHTAFSELISYNLQDWIPQLPDPYLMCFAGALLADCQEMLLRLFGGPSVPITESLDPAAEALQMIVHYGLIPPPGTDMQEFNGYVQSVATHREVKAAPLTFYDVYHAYRRYNFPWPIDRLSISSSG